VARASRAAGHEATSLPGLIADAVAPDALRRRASALGPIVLVAGTNGKTTTARLVARVVERALGTPIVNASGANLRQSIVSSLLLAPDPTRARSPAVFEVDEMALPAVAADLSPTVLVATNLLRDQLDRYGETQVIVDRWRSLLECLDRETTFVYCADDPRLAMLVRGLAVRTLTFGLDWSGDPGPGRSQGGTGGVDPVSCDRCGRPLEISARSIGHLGRFACPGGHVTWASPDVAFALSDGDLDGDRNAGERTAAGDRGGDCRGDTAVTLTVDGRRTSFNFRLSGLPFGYDAAAAAAAGTALGIPLSEIADALTDATAAFGRSEEIDVAGRRVVLALAKNPASLAEAAALAVRLAPGAVLIALNDAHADGRDVSWIWDAEIEPLLAVPTVMLAGERSGDLALRAKYDPLGARAARAMVEAPSLEDALAAGLSSVPEGDTVLVVATYTALLAIRSRLVELGFAPPAPR
jgi:lipid II isoglutaminyl synthase (glutamine-hydrolysing)